MGFNSHYKLGMRAIKTAIAVFLCLLIGYISGTNDTFYSSIAAVICVQQSYDKTLKKGYYRFLGTLVGGIIGYIVLEVSQQLSWYTKEVNLFVVPLCILLVIYIFNMFGTTGAISICCIVILSIIANQGKHVDDVMTYVITRVVNTSVGVLMAILVDKFIPNKKRNN